MRITSEKQLVPILMPLQANAQGYLIGDALDTRRDYLTLEEEMMKVGSLQHAQVAWEDAEMLAVKLLSEQGKDLKVLGYLLHCMQHDGSGVRYALSLRLLARAIMQPWWEHAYPNSDARAVVLRQRLFQQFIQRSLALLAVVNFTDAEEELAACLSSLAELQHNVAEKGLPSKEIDKLANKLNAVGTEKKPTPPPTTVETPATPAPVAKAPELHLEAGNERTNRQALLKMANFLGSQHPEEPLVYRLRRHAIWMSIHVLPVTHQESGKTELAPVSPDRIAEYQDGLEKGGDTALWQRVENSVALSPYWLEGHRISAALASQLGYTCCAEAIREETQRFVDRLPSIKMLKFSDGTPFLDKETADWLAQQPSSQRALTSQGAWQQGLEEAKALLNEGDLGAGLKRLDQGLSQALFPRDQVYWRLAIAELLDDAGLETLAKQHYQTLHTTATALGLEHWEPALVARLASAIKEKN